MPKKYYGKEGKKMSKGKSGLPDGLVMKSYPKAPVGGDMGVYRDSLEQSDAYGRKAIGKLKGQKFQ